MTRKFIKVTFRTTNVPSCDFHVAENSLRNSFLLDEDVPWLRLRLFRNKNFKVAPQTVGYVT